MARGDGAVLKTGKTPYYIASFYIDGREFRRSTQERGKRAALARLPEIRAAVAAEIAGKVEKVHARPRGPVKIGQLVTFGQAAMAWLHNHTDARMTAEVAKSARWSALWLIETIGADRPLAEIDCRLVEAVRNRRMSETNRLYTNTTKKVAPATVDRSATEPLRKILLYARRHGGRAADFDEINKIEWGNYFLAKKGGRKNDTRAINILTVAQEVAVLAVAIPALVAPARFSLFSGYRQHETIKLAWSDIHWPPVRDGVPDFSQGFIKVIGKGDIFDRTPMTRQIYDILQGERGKHPEIVFTMPRRHSGPAAQPHLPRSRSTNVTRLRGDVVPISEWFIRNQWEIAREQVGLTGKARVRWHDLRHTFATRLVVKGVPLPTVQELCRHADIETTMKYVHIAGVVTRAGLVLMSDDHEANVAAHIAHAERNLVSLATNR